jgi:deoxyribodipyrimidine photo-lyase
MRTLVWFRGKDLRVHDHAALHAACADSEELLPVFVLAPRYFARSAAHPAPHRLQFLVDSLLELQQAIEQRGSRLQLVHGPASTAIPRLVQQLAVERVMAVSSCEPQCRVRDSRIAAALGGVPFVRFEHETLTVPGSVRTGSGGPFQVYTPFARAAMAQLARVATLPAPKRLPKLPPALEQLALPELNLAHAFEALGLTRNSQLQPGGESAAQARLAHFVRGPLAHYDSDRDRMDLPGTSRLSADLRFGTLSVRKAWQAVEALSQAATTPGVVRYRAELLWREFAHHTLWERPELLSQPFRADFRGFPWLDDDAGFEAWWQGQTGYPVVDAAARQLLQEGFVHNRARMISASFLTKHLLVNYQRGEAHYLRYLTDGDLAQNNLGWQWSAGSGCDAQPYFRVFNPVTQGVRFDPDGHYVRRYLPELARLPTRYVHAPWQAPSEVLRAAGVSLGKNYPEPIVDHASARARYLLIAGEHLGSPSKRANARR